MFFIWEKIGANQPLGDRNISVKFAVKYVNLYFYISQISKKCYFGLLRWVICPDTSCRHTRCFQWYNLTVTCGFLTRVNPGRIWGGILQDIRCAETMLELQQSFYRNFSVGVSTRNFKKNRNSMKVSASIFIG